MLQALLLTLLTVGVSALYGNDDVIQLGEKDFDKSECHKVFLYLPAGGQLSFTCRPRPFILQG